ncbi:ABC transporter substrate-binding protein [Candidatus Bipolaricaulota bacterium]|nr:ABC transporter substrate-binding protein [Candidatus Bipolaricaulota bacterium]
MYSAVRRLLAVGLGVIVIAGQAQAGVLQVGISGEPRNLDPALYTDIASAWLVQNIYDPLVELSVTGEPLPEYSLCKAWEFNADATAITLHLRPGVRFHDGRELTAEDVVYNFEWILDPENASPVRKALAPVEEVEALDPYTVKVTFRYPFPEALQYWSRALIGIVPAASRPRGESPLARDPIGTGPYRFVEWKEGSHIVLEPFDDYWMEGIPPRDVSRVKFVFFADEAAKVAALLAGAVHLVDWVSPRDYVALQDVPGIELARIPGIQHQYVALNLASHPFGLTADEVGDPVAIERALMARKFMMYAIDREEIRDEIFYGMATIMYGPWYPDSEWFSPHLRGRVLHDPELARQYLEEYYALGGARPLRFRIIATNAWWFVDVATLIQEQLRQYGVEAEVIPLEKRALFATLKTLDWEAAVEDFAHGIPAVLRWLRFGYCKVPNHNHWYHAAEDLPPQYFPTHPGHEEFCRLWDEASSAPDPENRKELVWRMQEMLVENVIRIDLMMVDSLLAWRGEVRFAEGTVPLLGALHLKTVVGFDG